MMQLTPPEIGAEEARRTADQVLSGRAYFEAAQPPSLQERIFDWVAERFSDLFNALSSSGSRGLIAWLIIGVFLAVIVFLLTRLMRNLAPLPASFANPEPTIEVLGQRTAKQWLAAAVAAETEGDFRQGVRCRHRALVTGLVERKVVRARPDQTAGEIQQLLVATYPAASQPMSEATTLFQNTWYGWIVADVDSVQRFAELATQVETAADHNAHKLVST